MEGMGAEIRQGTGGPEYHVGNGKAVTMPALAVFDDTKLDGQGMEGTGEPDGYVQYYARRNAQKIFGGDNLPQLLYASYVDAEMSAHPRIMHSHKNSTEILLIASGEADFLIGYKSYHIRQGDLIVYNAGVVHDELTSIQNKVSLWCLAVEGLRLPGLPDNCLVTEREGVVFPTGTSYDELFYLFQMIFSSLRRGKPGAEDFTQYLTYALLTRARQVIMISAGEDGTLDGVEEENILGQRVMEYIDAHYHEPINLQSISNALNCSKYYLSHVFKDLCGYSPMNYLIKRRIGEAQSLLISTQRPLVEIAMDLGYDTQSYFTTQFMKFVGMSPNAYRKKYARHPDRRGRR